VHNLALVTTGTNGFSVTNTGIAATLTGSALADTLIGGGANDVLVGGTGNDSLAGGLGANTLTGGTGIDTFTVTGNDTIKDLGAGGADILSVALGATVNATVTNAWTATATTTNSGAANLTTNGLAVNLALVTTGINGFKVTNTGSAATLTGSALADTLTGGTGADTLVAGAGNDMLIGKAGNDRLTGGLGADTFWFDIATNATTNKDTITDFVTGTDKLQFSVSVLTALGAVGQFAVGDQRFWSSATGLAHDATDRLIYNTTTGALSYDSNGNVAGGAVIIEVLGTATHATLVAQDIWVS
jgi:Ca2+-binding RTX toxin-like protein